MKYLTAKLLLLNVGIVLATTAYAEKADRSKPMFLEARELRFDDVKQTIEGSGNVILTKGSLVIRAAKMALRKDSDGNEFATLTGTPDSPASIRQKRDAVDEFIEGQGESIEYDGRADTIKLINNAELRRLRGTTLADEITASVILYENLTDRFSADSGASSGGALPQGTRVRIMIVPKSSASISDQKAPEPTQASLDLRGTTKLENAPK